VKKDENDIAPRQKRERLLGSSGAGIWETLRKKSEQSLTVLIAITGFCERYSIFTL
jgi:hypothetical protein